MRAVTTHPVLGDPARWPLLHWAVAASCTALALFYSVQLAALAALVLTVLAVGPRRRVGCLPSAAVRLVAVVAVLVVVAAWAALVAARLPSPASPAPVVSTCASSVTGVPSVQGRWVGPADTSLLWAPAVAQGVPGFGVQAGALCAAHSGGCVPTTGAASPARQLASLLRSTVGGRTLVAVGDSVSGAPQAVSARDRPPNVLFSVAKGPVVVGLLAIHLNYLHTSSFVPVLLLSSMLATCSVTCWWGSCGPWKVGVAASPQGLQGLGPALGTVCCGTPCPQ